MADIFSVCYKQDEGLLKGIYKGVYRHYYLTANHECFIF